MQLRPLLHLRPLVQLRPPTVPMHMCMLIHMCMCMSVGMGMGKADAVPDAIRKGSTVAQNAMINVPMNGDTIPHDITVKFGGSIVMLKPAPPGTGVIAGESVRAVVELAGIKDIVTKVRRSTNPTNVVKATLQGLQLLKDPKAEIAKRKNYVRGSTEDNEGSDSQEE